MKLACFKGRDFVFAVIPESNEMQLSICCGEFVLWRVRSIHDDLRNSQGWLLSLKGCNKMIGASKPIYLKK